MINLQEIATNVVSLLEAASSELGLTNKDQLVMAGVGSLRPEDGGLKEMWY